jgi:hypothetical protein
MSRPVFPHTSEYQFRFTVSISCGSIAHSLFKLHESLLELIRIQQLRSRLGRDHA